MDIEQVKDATTPEDAWGATTNRAEGQPRLSDGFAATLEQMERDAFEKWWRLEGTFCDNPFTSKKVTALECWKARGRLNTPCRGIAHPNCDYLAACGAICNKCGQAV